MTAPVALARPDGSIAITVPGVPQAAPTTLALHGNWPAWAPGGELIAYSTLEPGRGEPRSSVVVRTAGGGHAGRVFQSLPGTAPVIAARVPHYVQWSPAGELLAIVAPGKESLTLYLSAADGSFASDPVADGAPLFPAWHRDGRLLAVHSGTELLVIDTVTRERTVVATEAAGFRTPAWAGDRLVYAVLTGDGPLVMSYDPVSGETGALHTFAAGVVICPAGDGTHVSLAVPDGTDSGTFASLWLSHGTPGAGRVERVCRGPFVAAHWAPGGGRVALIVPVHTGDGRFQVQVFNRDGSFAAAAEPWIPGIDFRTMIGFFDQYVMSHPIWAPDGSGLAVVGRIATDGRAAMLSDRVDDHAFWWTATRGAAWEDLGPADLAIFPPA